jgi:hypothetical protein
MITVHFANMAGEVIKKKVTKHRGLMITVHFAKMGTKKSKSLNTEDS